MIKNGNNDRYYMKMMGKCVLVFHIHASAPNGCLKPSSNFAGERLRPIAEEALRDGRIVHIVHERISTFPKTPEVIARFQESTA
jgi:hypothetical protein